MKRKAVSVVMLTLLLSAMLPLALNIKLVGAEPTTWYVDDDGGADFTRIQDAIDAASPGDTIYVYNGIYYENPSIGMDKPNLTIKGEDKSSTIVDGGGTWAVISIFADGVTINSLTVQNGGWDGTFVQSSCIYIGYNAESNNISNNIISNSRYGIALWESENSIVSENNISETEFGIFLEHGNHDQVIGNRISNSIVGIYSNYPYHSIVAGNIIEDMTACIPHTCGVYGIHFQEGGSNNTVVDNTVTGYTDYGIAIRYADGNYIAGNTLSGNFYGIELSRSSNNNIVTGNNVTSNGVGISVFDNSNNNLITMNDFSDSVPIGFYISDIGIWVDSSHDSTINQNNIANNGYGFYIYSTSNNEIYHNSIMDNTIQGYSYNSVNTWNNSYPSGGNYWSDYVNEDIYAGANQDEPGSDGIWDHPYVIDVDNQDNYPLVEPWGVVDATVDIYPDTLNTWSLFGRFITAYIELPEGYNVDNIDVSTVRLNDEVQAKSHPTKIGDYDKDDIPDLMVKFDRTDVVRSILRKGENTVVVTGLFTGKSFQGSETINVFSP